MMRHSASIPDKKRKALATGFGNAYQNAGSESHQKRFSTDVPEPGFTEALPICARKLTNGPKSDTLSVY